MGSLLEIQKKSEWHPVPKWNGSGCGETRVRHRYMRHGGERGDAR